MQTFFNPTTPFFDGEGKLLVGARVSFLDLETNASLIDITDSAGTPLPNPLFTGSDGRLRLENGNGAPAVPCIADGVSYKVVVERRTGADPIFLGGILQNPEELYETPIIAFVVTAMGVADDDSNSSVVGSVASVRGADKALGSVVCCGYYEAGDCPARVFTWVDSVSPPEDNGINVLRNPEDSSGYWKMSDPHAGTWDVRMAGLTLVETESLQNSQKLRTLLNVVNDTETQSTRVSRILFPRGIWCLRGGFTSYSKVVFAEGALLRFKGTSDKVLNFYGGIESYGGSTSERKIFDTPDGTVLQNNLTITCGQGPFYTSWIGDSKITHYSPIVDDVLVIDNNFNATDAEPTAPKIIVRADSSHPIIFSNCIIECDGRLSSSVSYVFRNCNFSDRFFSNNSFSDNVTLSGCSIDINEFESVDNWAKAMLMNGASVLDFQGRFCHDLSIKATADDAEYRIENGLIGTLTFRVRDGDSASVLNVLTISNSTVNKLNGDYWWKDLNIFDSTVSAGKSQDGNLVTYDGVTVKGSVVVRNSTLTGSSWAIGINHDGHYPHGTVSLYNSVVNGEVHGETVAAYDSRFASDVKNHGAATVMLLSGCTFSGDCKAETLGVNAFVVNNRFDTVGIGLKADNLTQCTYDNNSGNVLSKKVKLDASLCHLTTNLTQSSQVTAACIKVAIGQTFVPIPMFAFVGDQVRVRLRGYYTETQLKQWGDFYGYIKQFFQAEAVFTIDEKMKLNLPFSDNSSKYLLDPQNTGRGLFFGLTDYSGISTDKHEADYMEIEAEVVR